MLIFRYEIRLKFSVRPRVHRLRFALKEHELIFLMSTEIQGPVHKIERRGGLNRMLIRKGGYWISQLESRARQMIAVATLQHLPRFCASRQDFYSEICEEKKIVRCCNHRRSELAGVLHKFDDCFKRSYFATFTSACKSSETLPFLCGLRAFREGFRLTSFHVSFCSYWLNMILFVYFIDNI